MPLLILLPPTICCNLATIKELIVKIALMCTSPRIPHTSLLLLLRQGMCSETQYMKCHHYANDFSSRLPMLLSQPCHPSSCAYIKCCPEIMQELLAYYFDIVFFQFV